MISLILALIICSTSRADNDYPVDSNADFDLFKQIYARTDAHSLDDFLAELKNKQPYMFKNYLLGYNSRSLQQSSSLYPRVVLFNDRADLNITFNGHPQHRGYNNLEIIRFDHEENRFEFFEVSFSQSSKPSGLDKPNPKKCLECHQSIQRNDIDPRPNWEPYATWPGFYGSLDDHRDIAQTRIHLKYVDNLPEEDKILIYNSVDEEKNLQEFTANIKPQHPRYQLLEPLSRLTYNNDGSKTDRREPNRTNNAPFIEALTRLNFKRVFRLIQQDKEIYELVKWTLFSAGQCYSRTIDQTESYTWLKSVSPRTENPLLFEKTFHNPGFISSSWVSPYLNYFFEPFGIDTEDWSLDFKSDGGRFAFSERFGTQRFTHRAFIEETEDQWMKDKDILPYLVKLKIFHQQYDALLKQKYTDDIKLQKNELQKTKNAICDEIDKKSLAQLGNLETVKKIYQNRLAVNSIKQEKPLIQRCISCHVDSSAFDAPYIPFDNEEKLKIALQKNNYKRGRLIDEITFRTGSYATASEQMPPRGVPTTRQRQELIAYLNQLISH